MLTNQHKFNMPLKKGSSKKVISANIKNRRTMKKTTKKGGKKGGKGY